MSSSKGGSNRATMGTQSVIHLLAVSIMSQGHINPMLRLGKLLASKGLLVTFSAPKVIETHLKTTNRFTEEPTPIGHGFIRFEPLEDGWEETYVPGPRDIDRYITQLEQTGRQSIPQMIKRHAEQGRPVSCIVTNSFMSWVSDLAESLGLPSATLWIQSCASFAAYYHYCHNLVPFPNEENPEIDVQLPCMPLLKSNEIPTFLHPTAPSDAKRPILDLCKNLDKPFCVLMETFQELEPEIINYISKLCPIKAIGPLFKNPKTLNARVHGDLMEADDCIDWLDTKPPSSVVYISFGSLVYLKQDQWDEIAYGLLSSGVTFLWVFKPPSNDLDIELLRSPEWLLKEAGDKAKIVKWSPQEKVLAHPSVACFVTHCGWNSSMEALASAVPVVTFPMLSDQVTNAKYLVDIFKVGVRMSGNTHEKKLVTRDEVERCLLEATVGPKAAEKKRNALKWKALAEAAVADGGSSDLNIEAFVEELKKKSVVVTCGSNIDVS